MLSWFEPPIMIGKRRLSARPSVLVPLAVLVSVVDAHAYLDPGTGSYVFQMVIAVVLSGAFTIKHFWHRLKARLVGSKAQAPNDDAPAS